MRGRMAVLLMAAFAAWPAAVGAAPTLIPVGTFDRPTFVTAPPGDVNRVFVLERPGAIRLVKDGVRQAAPFLDLTDLVLTADSQSSERGLLSAAFAPDYDISGRFYVYYTARAGAAPHAGDIVIDEFRRSATNPDVADRASRRTVLTVDHFQFDHHNGGQLAFGPDGLLWAGTGDGGGVGDPAGNAQNPFARLGKILRLDPSPGAALAPGDNPFAGGGGDALVWAGGLRNPFRFSFDRLSGDLAIGDVGEQFDEEIDFVSRADGLGRAANYGWNRIEGIFRFNVANPTSLVLASPIDFPPGYVGPLIERRHSTGWCSIIGGYVVRDPALPELVGRYVYGDYCNGVLYSAILTPSGALGDALVGAPKVDGLSSFGEDGCGRLYVTSIQGPVFRLAASGACAGPAPVPFPTPTPIVPGGPGALGGAVAGGARPGGAAAGGAAGLRSVPPRLAARAAKRQPAVRRGYVAVLAGCRERCVLTATGRLRLGLAPRATRRATALLALRRARRTTLAGKRTTLRLRLAPPARRAAARALARHRSVVAVVDVSAVRNGQRARARLTVRITG